MKKSNLKFVGMFLIIQLTVLVSFAQTPTNQVPVIKISNAKPMYHENDTVKIYIKNTTNKPLWYVIEEQILRADGWDTYTLDINNHVSEVPVYRLIQPGKFKSWYDILGHHRHLPKLKRFPPTTVVTNLRYGLSYFFKTMNDRSITYSKTLPFKHKTVIIK